MSPWTSSNSRSFQATWRKATWWWRFRRISFNSAFWSWGRKNWRQPTRHRKEDKCRRTMRQHLSSAGAAHVLHKHLQARSDAPQTVEVISIKQITSQFQKYHKTIKAKRCLKGSSSKEVEVRVIIVDGYHRIVSMWIDNNVRMLQRQPNQDGPPWSMHLTLLVGERRCYHKLQSNKMASQLRLSRAEVRYRLWGKKTPA